MISTRNRVGCSAFALAITALRLSPAFAEEFEQHDVHEHGKVTLNVAVDGSRLHVVLEAPAVNVVGFEHAPQTEAEHAAATRAHARLQSGRELIGVPRAAQCRLERARVEAPAWFSREAAASPAQKVDRAARNAHPDHKADDQGSAAHDAPEHEQHGEYEAALSYTCEAPQHLTWFEPWLLDDLHDVVEARLNVTSPRGQRSEIVGRARTRVAL